MRAPNRLDKVYSELKYLHKKYLPDLRFCQLFLNFLGWLNTSKGIEDAFYIEDDKMIDFFIQYIDEMVGKSTKYSG